MLKRGLQYSLKPGITLASAITSCVTLGGFLTSLGQFHYLCFPFLNSFSPLGYIGFLFGDLFLGISLFDHDPGLPGIA